MNREPKNKSHLAALGILLSTRPSRDSSPKKPLIALVNDSAPPPKEDDED